MDLYIKYFGTGDPNTTNNYCNMCGVKIDRWGSYMETHIRWHESVGKEEA